MSPTEIATAARKQHYAATKDAAPTCTAIVERKRGPSKPRVCGQRLSQNTVEKERGTWWCSKCHAYTDGSSGFSQDQLAVLRPSKVADRYPVASGRNR